MPRILTPVPHAPKNAVDKLVSAVTAKAGNDLAKRRDVLQHHLARLEITDEEMHAWRDGLDIVGSAYERLFSGKERRDAGQFFTPFWAGEVMAGWAFQEKVALAMDPGVGSGGLLIPAARHPRRKGAKLLGLDLDPLAVSMLEANTRLRGMEGVEARQGNFLLDSLNEQPGAILCNPPYSRHHAIPAMEKLQIHDGFEQRLGVRFNGLAALHVLFLVRALEIAADGARIAFITPSDWLDVGYGKKVKEFLLSRAQVEAIILIEESHLFFEGVLTTAAITLIRKTPPTSEPTKVLRIEGDPTRFKPKLIVDLLTGRVGLNDMQEEPVALDPTAKWSRPSAKRRSGTKLGSVARVRRGIATGANAFFVISERERKKLDIPKSQLKRCITSPRVFIGIELTAKAMDAFDDDVPRWLVDCDNPEEANRDTPLGRYLRRGRKLKIHTGYLAASREPWHRLEQRGKSPILFTYFNRDAPRFVRNLCGAVPLNNWLIVEPNQDVDPDALCRALQSKSVGEQLLEGRRVYGGGLWKLEPSELVEVRVSHKLFAAPGKPLGGFRRFGLPGKARGADRPRKGS
jgi:adenine-specific DNA-methyltransferase